jgi:DNA-binding XRE family transcriptional regulator
MSDAVCDPFVNRVCPLGFALYITPNPTDSFSYAMSTELTESVRLAVRKNEQRVLRRMAESRQVELAELLGVSDATVSRMKDGDIARFSLLLAAMGLKIVPDSARVYESKVIEALTLLAKDNLSRATPDDWVLDE